MSPARKIMLIDQMGETPSAPASGGDVLVTSAGWSNATSGLAVFMLNTVAVTGISAGGSLMFEVQDQGSSVWYPMVSTGSSVLAGDELELNFDHNFSGDADGCSWRITGDTSAVIEMSGGHKLAWPQSGTVSL